MPLYKICDNCVGWYTMMAGRGYIVGWYTCVYIKALYVKCFEPAIPWDPVSRWSIKEDFDVVSNSSIKRCYLPSLYTSKKICVKKKLPLKRYSPLSVVQTSQATKSRLKTRPLHHCTNFSLFCLLWSFFGGCGRHGYSTTLTPIDVTSCEVMVLGRSWCVQFNRSSSCGEQTIKPHYWHTSQQATLMVFNFSLIPAMFWPYM